VKNRLQLQQRVPGSTGLYRGPWDVIVRSVKQDGLRVLYRGHTATLAMEVKLCRQVEVACHPRVWTSVGCFEQIPGMCAWFTTYEWCKRTLSQSTLPGFTSHSGEPTGATTIVAGAAAGVAYWTAFYPADTVRSEVQTRVHAGASPSFLHVFREVYQGSGVRGLYRGLSTAVIRAIPGNAVCFSVYELVSSALHDRFNYLM
jgi:solute carrier family 25 (mitochondrial carnitine/acylcarnitine transporter), member 20/29